MVFVNGILNGPMVFSMVLIRRSSAFSSMIFWMVYHSEYHWRRSWIASYKNHSEYHWTIQNTIQSSTIQIPLAIIPPKYHWSTIEMPLAITPPRTIEVPFKYHSNVYLHRPLKYQWRTIQIPFKYHSTVYIHRPPKYHSNTIQIPLAIIPPRTIQWYLSDICCKAHGKNDGCLHLASSPTQGDDLVVCVVLFMDQYVFVGFGKCAESMTTNQW